MLTDARLEEIRRAAGEGHRMSPFTVLKLVDEITRTRALVDAFENELFLALAWSGKSPPPTQEEWVDVVRRLWVAARALSSPTPAEDKFAAVEAEYLAHATPPAPAAGVPHACGTGGEHELGAPGCEYEAHHCAHCHENTRCTTPDCTALWASTPEAAGVAPPWPGYHSHEPGIHTTTGGSCWCRPVFRRCGVCAGCQSATVEPCEKLPRDGVCFLHLHRAVAFGCPECSASAPEAAGVPGCEHCLPDGSRCSHCGIRCTPSPGGK